MQNTEETITKYAIDAKLFRLGSANSLKKLISICSYMQNNEENIAKYAVDVNLLQLGSTNPKKHSQPLDAFFLFELS